MPQGALTVEPDGTLRVAPHPVVYLQPADNYLIPKTG
jgi:hypothetical protein